MYNWNTNFFLILMAIFVVACTSDQAEPQPSTECGIMEEVSFATMIKPIFEANCSYEGCHAASSALGDFTKYNTMLEDLENGKIEERALIVGNMPPQNKLDSLDLVLLQCWLDAGHPDN